MKLTHIKSIFGFYVFVLINILTSLNSFSAKNETISIICGGDSVTVSYPGYENLGVVEWQESVDTLNWVDIPEVFGAEYRFYPTQTKYYRGVLKLTDTLYYSPVTLVLMPPVANAGLDKVLGNKTVVLLGNSDGYSQGEWTVFEGDSGIVAEPFNKYSLFGGKYNIDYKLQWKLLNTCGYSVDTVNIRFEEVNAKTNFIVVDMTDSLYSDSTEIANGILRIKFSDPEIIPQDSVVLIGMRDSLSFIHKVVSFTLEDSIYHFVTIQGSFEDLFKGGTLNIGDAINQGILEGNEALKSSRIGEGNTFPTRKTIKQYSQNKEIFLIYSNYNDGNSLKSSNIDNEKNLLFTLSDKHIFEAYDGGLKVNLKDFVFQLAPNFVLKYSLFPFNFSYGLDNSVIKCDYTILIEASKEFNFKSEEKTIWRPMNQKKLFVIQAGAIPIVVIMNTSVKASCELGFNAGFTFTQKGTYTNYLTATIEDEFPFINIKTKEISSLFINIGSGLNGGVHARLTIGPEVSFKVYDVIGPYVQTPIKIDANLNANIDGNWSGEASVGLYGIIGAKAEIEKTRFFKQYTLFDYKYSLWGDALSLKFKWPKKLELVSGNNQTGSSGVQLAKPVIFKVTNSFGNGVPLVPVRFELENGNGSVQNTVLTTDALGQVKANWILGSNTECKLKAYVFDYKNTNIENSPLFVKAFSSGTSNPCANSNLAISIKSATTYKYPSVSGGVAPYTYSINGTDYSNSIPQFDNSITGNFKVYVKDKNQCSAERAFSIGESSVCANSDLTMDVNTLSKSVQITGKKGTPPYTYSIDNETNFSTNNTFSNLTSGVHTVFVKDSKQCISSGEVGIDVQTTTAIKASYPLDGAYFIPVINLTFSWLAGNYATNQVYDLFLKKGSEEYSLIASDLSTTYFNYSTALANSSSYTWKVAVKGTGGTVIDSREFTFTTVSNKSTTPVSPVLVYPANGDATGIYLTFQWLAQEGDFIYDLYLDELNATKLVGSNLTNPQLTINKLRSGVTYYWKVKVKSTVTGESAISPVWSFTTNSSLGSAFEYWFNNNYEDRKYSKVPSQLQLLLSKSLSTDELQVGLNVLHFRFKDTKGYWSSVVSEFFHKLPSTTGDLRKITTCEYWFDDDYANKVSTEITPGQTITTNEGFDANSLQTGLHSYHVRFMDNAGQWSSVVSEFFHKLPTSAGGERKITAYEFWYDNNYAGKTTVPITPEQIFSLNNGLDAISLPTGLHSYHVRYKDDAGQWSSVVSEFFHKLPVSSTQENLITAYRYWFNREEENIQLINLATPVNPYELIRDISVSGLPSGDNTIHFQFKDTRQAWSSVLTDTFNMESLLVQEIALKTGWNIMSLYVMPNDVNMKNLVQPLIDDSKLKKVMDEAGKVIEDWGYFGGWQNTIVDLKNTEGYKINVTAPTTMEVTGIPTQLPFEIALNTGWNIISWPSSNEQDGMAVFQSLIDAGKLKKVMDESGKVIEDWGYFGGWQNSIGNLKPGEGYKVNVTENCTLTINESGTKSEVIIPELIASSHFAPAFKGNGTDHMNINLVNLTESGIMEGDEIGIFDGGVCVGSAQITNLPPIAIGALIINRNSISIPVSAIDGIEGKNGYSEGNSINLKLFRNGSEYPLTLKPLNQSKTVFEKGSSLFAQVDLVTKLNGLAVSGLSEMKVYPNPFNDEVTVEINLAEDAEVEVLVLNQLGQQVKYIETVEQLNRGIHRLIWDGTNPGKSKVAPGIYLIRMKINDTVSYRKVIYSK